MSDLVQKLLMSISTTTGFILFCSLVAVGYVGIWFLFLFEEKPKTAKKAAGAGGEKAEEARPEKEQRSGKAPAQASKAKGQPVAA